MSEMASWMRFTNVNASNFGLRKFSRKSLPFFRGFGDSRKHILWERTGTQTRQSAYRKRCETKYSEEHSDARH